MKVDCKYKKLGDIGTVITGATPSTSNADYYKYQDFPFFKPGDIQEHGITILDSSETYVSKEAYNQSRKLPQGSVLTTCIGTIGKVGIIQQDSICNQQINAIIPHNEIGSQYLAYAILSIRDILRAKKNGPVVPIINKTSFSSFRIPVPALTIQQRIVAELDGIQGMIDGYKAQIADLDALAQSIFLDTFGDPVTNPKGWEMAKLSDVFDLITDGTHYTPTYTENHKDGIKFLSAKDVATGKIMWDKVKLIPFALHEQLHKRLAPQRGDILLCKNGTTGICALVDTDEVFDIYVSLALLRTHKNYNRIYLVHAINSPMTKSQFDSSIKGIGVPNLHLREIKKTTIPLPPLALQERFAARVKAIEALKTKLREQVADCEMLMAERMQAYFS